MTVLDAPLRKVSLDLIAKFGKSMTLTFLSNTAGSYDPETRTPTAGSPVTASVKGIMEPMGLIGAKGNVQNDGVMAGDQKVTIAAAGLAAVPQSDDTITIDSVTYRIVYVDPIYGGDLPVLHELHVRR